MPVDYFCEGCGLVFSVGPYGMRSSRYPGRLLLVCRSCGTVHELQYPFDAKKPLRLVAQLQPLKARRKPDSPTFLQKRKWHECVTPSIGETFGEDEAVVKISCSHCRTSGPLSATWEPENTMCPVCHADKLVQNGGWVT